MAEVSSHLLLDTHRHDRGSPAGTNNLGESSGGKSVSIESCRSNVIDLVGPGRARRVPVRRMGVARRCPSLSGACRIPTIAP